MKNAGSIIMFMIYKEQKLYEASERNSKDYSSMMMWCDKLIAYDMKDGSIVELPLSSYATEVKR